MRYVLLVAIVFAVNLLPAFGPPTWSLLVYARLRWHLDPILLILLGDVASTSGRYVLATTSRRLRNHFPAGWRANLSTMEQRLVAARGRAATLAGLFVVSPLPSAQLFIAAGLLQLRLVWLCVAFFAGRLVTYSLYVTTSVVADQQFSKVLSNIWGNPWSVALQFVMLGALALLPLRPWSRRAGSS